MWKQRYGFEEGLRHAIAWYLSDVSPENDGRSKLEYDGGFGGLAGKERTHEAVTILGRADCLCDLAG